MGRKATKAVENACYKARKEAGFESRVAVSAVTGIETTRLANIELDKKLAYPEEIECLSVLYNAPDLKNWYCSKKCPIGMEECSFLKDVEFSKLERNILKFSKNCKTMHTMVDSLTDIAYDGEVDYNEKIIMKNEIKPKLIEARDSLNQLIIWIDKNVGDLNNE